MKRILAIFSIMLMIGSAMSADFTPAQRISFKAALWAETNSDLVSYRTNGQTTLIKAWYEAEASPAFVVWKTDVAKAEVFGALNWKNFTPSDSPNGTPEYTNRALSCQSFQFNIQTMLISPGETINMAKLNIRNGIKDSIESVPSGPAGALLDAGWASVKAVSYRNASRVEKMFATGTGTTAVPGTMVFEGSIPESEITLAMVQ